MKRTILLAATAGLAIAGFTACGGDDEVTPDQLKAALVAQGIEEDLADCIVQDLESELSSEDFDTLARADEDLDDVSPELEAVLTATVTDCAIAGADG